MKRFSKNVVSVTDFLRISVLFWMGAMLFSCATPSSPTGGPPDEEEPDIIETEPETGTTNFKGNEIILHFSEFVDRASFSKALVIEPQLGLVYELDWGRKSVAIQFENELPDSTTLIVTVGTDFSDVNNNTLSSPYKVAVSTGKNIDKGKLVARVMDARTGEGTEGKRVLLYRSPVDLTLPANYVGESDTSGVVHFSYLRQGKYKAFWLDDRNRNRIWDKNSERAQPFKKEFITLKKAGEDTLGTLHIARSDTSKPKLQGIGLFSSQRMRLRFSENIMLTDSIRMRVQDSTGTPVGKAYPLYVLPGEEYVLFAQNTKSLSPDLSYQINVRNVRDAAGNVQPFDTLSFTGSAQKDTTEQRIIGTSVGQGIFPDDPVKVGYAEPIRSASIRDSIKVVVGDSVRSQWENLEIQQNELRILPDSTWKQGVDYEFRVWNPSIEDYNKITPTIWHPKNLGALSISFADTTTKAAARPTHLSVQRAEGQTVLDTTFVGQITVEGLAPVKHQVRLYQDLNENGKWDAGMVKPFKAPEPYYARNNIPVQQGLTADLTVQFKE